MNTTKRSEKFRTKSGLFAGFLRSPGREKSPLMVHAWPIYGRCCLFISKKRFLCGQKAVAGKEKRQILPTLSRLTAVFRPISDLKCVSSDKKRSRSGRTGGRANAQGIIYCRHSFQQYRTFPRRSAFLPVLRSSACVISACLPGTHEADPSLFPQLLYL